ncbi:MAG: DUF3575 domain-containing protein [Prevotella sp.]|nr:DUF3575 domain-containing protein [Prevotella sp.]
MLAMPYLNDTTYYKPYPYVIIIDNDDPLPELTAEEFFDQAACVVFPVNKWDLPLGSSLLNELEQRVIPQLNLDSLELVKMVFRGTASPEGPVSFNSVLGQRRVQTLYDYVTQRMTYHVADSLLTIDTEIEDYASLCLMMQRAQDSDYATVRDLYTQYGNDLQTLKNKMRAVRNGQLWLRLLRTYFPQLRTARFVMVLRKVKVAEAEKPIIPETPEVPEIPEAPEIPEVTASQDTAIILPRREMLAIKTNLLLDGAYMPGYDRWCPIPNVALEYYPKSGHFTFGASFDMPWWQHYDEHKFFQLRNYQVETRYYFRPGNPGNPGNTGNPRTSGASGTPGAPTRPAFAGFYLQAYAHAGIFGICFDANRGWVGEGAGAGLGLGYVIPISKKGHWRLELGVQAGFFRCKYDPYQYENPVNPAYHDNLYYYKWTRKPELFKKRQYRWNWIGPTRIGITLSYDLLYRRIQKRGVSFRNHETVIISEAPMAPAQERRADYE